jgi:hypothetical protein
MTEVNMSIVVFFIVVSSQHIIDYGYQIFSAHKKK